MIRRLFPLFVCAAVAAAQDPPPPRAFLIDDHRNVVFADLAALRARGIWDELEVSVLKVAFRQLEKECGFPLAALDRVTMVADPPQEGGMALRVRQVCVLEGNAPLDVPDRVARGSWQRDMVGGQAVWRRAGAGELFVRPRPELQVSGAEELIAPVLEGRPRAGQPCADVLSLLSGRGDNLAYFVIDVGASRLQRTVLQRLLGEVAWPDGDAPAFLLLRLRAIGEADDPHLEVESVVRHGRAGEGLAITVGAVDAWLEQIQKEPQLRALKPLWPSLVKKQDRTDLSLRLDLGRARDAVGRVALLLAPLLIPREVVAVEKEPAAEPPPPAKK